VFATQHPDQFRTRKRVRPYGPSPRVGAFSSEARTGVGKPCDRAGALSRQWVNTVRLPVAAEVLRPYIFERLATLGPVHASATRPTCVSRRARKRNAKTRTRQRRIRYGQISDVKKIGEQGGTRPGTIQGEDQYEQLVGVSGVTGCAAICGAPVNKRRDGADRMQRQFPDEQIGTIDTPYGEEEQIAFVARSYGQGSPAAEGHQQSLTGLSVSDHWLK